MENGNLIRSFIAVEISDVVRRNLGAAQSELKKIDANVKWVKPEDIHLTLSFLGGISPRTITGAGEQLDIIGDRGRPLSFNVTGLGTFGKRHLPRVVWAGVMGDIAALSELQTEVHTAMRNLGLPLDDRAFKPHMTIGRVRSARGSDELKRVIGTKRETKFGHVDVSRVIIMKSVLTPVGPKYSVLHESPLRMS